MVDLSIFKPFADFVAESKSTVAAIFAAGALAQHGVRWWWDRRNLKNGSFRRRLLFFAVRLEERGADGPVVVQLKPIGDEHELKDVVGIPALESQIAHATRKAKNGLLQLKHEHSHKRMMHIFERKIEGNDPIGMSDWIAGAPTNDRAVAFMPAFYCEDDVSMIYVFVVNANALETADKRMRNAEYRARMVPAAIEHHEESVEMLKKMGEQTIDRKNSSPGTALVRFIEITTARTGERSRNQSMAA